MIRKQYVLAVLSAADGAFLTPVQAQKLFFLLDRKVASLVKGPHFQFEAYDYGPFDKSIYSELRELEQTGHVEIEVAPNSLMRRYRPSAQGLQLGRELLNRLPEVVQSYIRDLSSWVRAQTFASLVTSIYNEYPEMRANSVFRY
jgi:uncharacterized protein